MADEGDTPIVAEAGDASEQGDSNVPSELDQQSKEGEEGNDKAEGQETPKGEEGAEGEGTAEGEVKPEGEGVTEGEEKAEGEGQEQGDGEETQVTPEGGDGQEQTEGQQEGESAEEIGDLKPDRMETLSELMLKAAEEIENEEAEKGGSEEHEMESTKLSHVPIPTFEFSEKLGFIVADEESDEDESEEADEEVESSAKKSEGSGSDSWASDEFDDEGSGYSSGEQYVKFGKEFIKIDAFKDKYAGYTHKELNEKYEAYYKVLKKEQRKNQILQSMIAEELHLDPNKPPCKKDRKLPVTDRQYDKELKNFSKFTKDVYQQCKSMALQTMKLEKKAKVVQKRLDDKRKEFFELATTLASKAKTRCPKPGQDLNELINKAMDYERKATTAREKCIHVQLLYDLLKMEVEEWKKGGAFDFGNLELLEKETRSLMDKLDIQNANVVRMKKQMIASAQSLAHIRMKSANQVENAAKQKEMLKTLGHRLDEMWELANTTRAERKGLERHMSEIKKDSGLHKYPLLVENFKDLNDKVVLARKEVKSLSKLLDDKRSAKTFKQKGVHFQT